MNNQPPFGVGQSFGQQAPRPSQPQISPGDLKSLNCENCQGEVFSEGVIIKTVSALLTGNGKEGMLPIPVFFCVKCQEPVEKYLPDELKKSPKLKI